MNYNNDNEWIFTFGIGQEYGGYCVRIKGSYIEARKKMMERYGTNWAFQYSATEWDEWKKDPLRAWHMEKEMVVIK